MFSEVYAKYGAVALEDIAQDMDDFWLYHSMYCRKFF